MPDNKYRKLVQNGAEIVTGGAREAAAAFLGHATPETPAPLAGRLDRRGRELWDGAHNPAATAWLRANAGGRYEIVVASVLADKDADAMLSDLAELAPRLIATQSSNLRALPAAELAARAAGRFADVRVEPDPHLALALARESTREGILVTGSLYLLADLSTQPHASP